MHLLLCFDKPKKGKSRKAAALTHLVVPLLQRLLAQPRPRVLPVERLGHLERDVEVAALDREVEPGRLVLDEVEGDLQGEGKG